MLRIEVSRCGGNVLLALKRLKRVCDKNGLSRRLREIERRTKATADRRREEAAAKKRQAKRVFNLAKNVLTVSRRYKNTPIKDVIDLLQ